MGGGERREENLGKGEGAGGGGEGTGKTRAVRNEGSGVEEATLQQYRQTQKACSQCKLCSQQASASFEATLL